MKWFELIASAFIGVFCTLAMSLLVGLPQLGESFEEIDTVGMQVGAASLYELPRRLDTGESLPDPDLAADSSEILSQISVSLPRRQEAGGATILITGLQPDTRLFVNRVRAGSSSSLQSRLIGLGSAWAYIGVDSHNQVNEVEGLDLLVPSASPQPEFVRIWMSEADLSGAMERAFAQSFKRTTQFITAGGYVALAATALGLIMGGNLPLFTGGLVLSLAHLARIGVTGGPSETLYWNAALVIAGTIGAALMVRASVGNNRLVRCILQGTIICAAIGWALSIWILFAPPQGKPSLDLVLLANTAILPTLALSLPLLGTIAVRDAVVSLVSARQALAERDAYIGMQKAQLQEEVRKQAVLEERQRFVRDMHDGVGGQLLNLLMKVRGRSVGLNDVETEIERSIADLRLVVESLDQVGNDLATALEAFRGRTSVQMSGSGIDFDWKQEGPVEDWRFGARQVLSIYRSMQEAIANAVRHADPKTVTVRVVAGDPEIGKLKITVSDDGCGFHPDSVASGRGMGNIRNRVIRLGGELEVDSVPGSGTRVSFLLPARNDRG